MKIKRLTFPSVKDGIKGIKEEYGPDAVIVDIKEKGKGQERLYEIVVALDEDHQENQKKSEELAKKLDEMMMTIKSLSERISQAENEAQSRKLADLPASLQGFHRRMTLNGLHPSIADSIISEVYRETGKFAEDRQKAYFFLKRALSKKIRVGSLNGSEKHIALLGPSGAGKTDTTKKISRRLKEEGKAVSIIAYDPVRKERYHEYMVFSEMTGVPFSFASREEDLPFMVGRDRSRKVIDITGSASVQRKALERLTNSSNLIVMPSWARDEKVQQYCNDVGADVAGLIFTKLDEEEKVGHLCDFAITADKPVYFLTVGAGVKDLVIPDHDTFCTILLQENIWRDQKERRSQ